MHVAALFATISTLAAIVLGIVPVACWRDPCIARRTKRAIRGAFVASVVLPVAIVTLLWTAQREVCLALGGSWNESYEGCRNEWGGNGNNDPSDPGWVPIPDPVVGDGPGRT